MGCLMPRRRFRTVFMVVLELNPRSTTKHVVHTMPCVSLLEDRNYVTHRLRVLVLVWEGVRTVRIMLLSTAS
jgi:hypothetical protein